MKILYVTTIGITMIFFKDLIRQLLDEGHSVDILCNEEIEKVPDCYREWGCTIHHHTASRSPFAAGNFRAVRQIREFVAENNYDIVHCHTPIAAACTRLACRSLRKNGLKVIYTVHGFHFYKGAPLKNWLFYYPVEKFCSHYTDILITINQEDYAFAQRRMKAADIAYVPGVGIDLQKFSASSVSVEEKRAELGIPDDAFLLLSVGELNCNKNHEVILRAMSLLSDPNIHYAIAGTGDLREYLLSLSEELGIRDHVHLLGYRNDVAELYRTADVFVFPSFREGLSVSLMEAMASGLPCIVSDIRGNRDLIDKTGGMRFDPSDVHSIEQAMRSMLSSDLTLCGNWNAEKVSDYSTARINELMKQLYSETLNL